MSQNIINICCYIIWQPPNQSFLFKNFNVQIFIYWFWIFQKFTIDKIHDTTKYENKVSNTSCYYFWLLTWTIYKNLEKKKFNCWILILENFKKHTVLELSIFNITFLLYIASKTKKAAKVWAATLPNTFDSTIWASFFKFLKKAHPLSLDLFAFDTRNYHEQPKLQWKPKFWKTKGVPSHWNFCIT